MPKLRCQVGNLIQFDCPGYPQKHGRKARVIAPASINGPDWWELELCDEFFLVPDGQSAGSRIKTSQAFAPDASLKPIPDEKTPEPAATGSFYAVAPSGVVFGPPVGMAEARKLVARHSGGGGAGWHIVTLDDLADTLTKLDEVWEANYRARMNSQEVH